MTKKPKNKKPRRSKLETLERIQQLPGGSLWVFAIKQAWAALFGGLLLAAIILTKYIDLPWLPRYDWLFIYAIAVQVFMLWSRLERPHEVITILLFHLVGLGMEVFKTSSSIGAWIYPGESYLELGQVPLFAGFMYAAVGSYIARSWRVMHLSFKPYPNRFLTVLLAIAIYVNFFSHHYIYDYRWFLFAAVIALYSGTWVRYKLNKTVRHMPLVVAFGLIAFFIWVAENTATFTSIWIYPNQVEQWEMVGIGKLGSWYLLMIISFIMVDMLCYIRRRHAARKRRLKYHRPN